MKRKWLLIALTCVLAALLAFIPACGTSKSTPAASTVTPLQQVEKRVESLEATVANLAGRQAGEVTKADLDKIGAEIEDIKDALNKPNRELDAANEEIASLKARVAALEAGPSVPTATGGKVTVEIVDQGPLLVYSTNAGMQYTFRVRISNGTNDYKYVAYSLNLVCITPKAAVNVDETGMTIFGGYGVTYTTLALPAEDKATQILFAPDIKIPVAKGGVVEVQHLLTIKTTDSEQWEGNLTGVVVSSTW